MGLTSHETPYSVLFMVMTEVSAWHLAPLYPGLQMHFHAGAYDPETLSVLVGSQSTWTLHADLSHTAMEEVSPTQPSGATLFHSPFGYK